MRNSNHKIFDISLLISFILTALFCLSSASIVWAVCDTTPTVYSTATDAATYVFSTDCDTITVKTWGAGGGGGCFISTTHMAFNPDLMRGVAILGFIAILWRLIFRIRAYGLRRKAQGIRLQPSPRPGRDDGSASKEQEFSSLNGDPQSSIIKRNMAQQACGIWKVKYQVMEQDLHEIL